MGTCPNCGSYVSPGSNVCSCGTTFGGTSHEEKCESEKFDFMDVPYNRYISNASKSKKQGDYLKAIEYYDKALNETNIFRNRDLREKGEACYLAERYDEALQCFNEAFHDPIGYFDCKTYRLMARTLDSMNRFDEALEAYETSLDLIQKDYEHKVEHVTKYGTLGEAGTIRYIEDRFKKSNIKKAIIFNDMALSYLLRGDFELDSAHYETAIKYVEEAIQLDYDNSNSWNVKAIILVRLGRYEQSKRFYDTSLDIQWSDVVVENRARMLKSWALELADEGKFQKAIDLLEEAIECLSKIQTTENKRQYESLIISIIDRREFKEQYGVLKGIGRENLITITGISYYMGNIFEKKMRLELEREPGNEFDSDAIAVYLNGEMVGYVANSDDTASDMSLKASEIHDPLKDAYAEYVLHYQNRYHIARILTFGK